MSTRGLMGIRKKGETKAQYNHYDSYISGLGKNIIETINNIPKKDRLKKLNDTFDNIVLVKETDENYKALHAYQGNLQAYLNGLNIMIDNYNFIFDTLFCEYAYIINLDTNALDITFGWRDRITKSYDLMNLNYEEIEKEINDIESEEK